MSELKSVWIRMNTIWRRCRLKPWAFRSPSSFAGLFSDCRFVVKASRMKYAGFVETGDPHSSQSIDELVYGTKD